MQKVRKMKLELGNHPELTLLKELSALKKSRPLRDPSTSPSQKSPATMDSLLRNPESETGKNEPESSHNDNISTLEKIAMIAENLRYSVDRQNGNQTGIKRGSVLGHHDRTALEKITMISENLRYSVSRQNSCPKEERDDASDRAGWIEISLTDSKLGTPKAYHMKGNKVPNPYKKGAKHFVKAAHEEPSTVSHGKGQADALPIGYNGTDGSFRREMDMPALTSQSTGKLTARIRNIRKDKARRSRRLYLQSPCSERLKRNTVLQNAQSMSCQEPWNRRCVTPLVSNMSVNSLGGSDELDISELPQDGHGCGIPWNWSRIHSRGKNILDMAGRSLSCGAPDPVTRKPLGKPFSRCLRSSSGESLPATSSDFSDTSPNTDSESLPLLEPGSCWDPGSQSEGDRYVGQGQEQRLDSLLSNSRIPVLGQFTTGSQDNHLSLNNKYRPKYFHDIVGQNLITQALSNALLKGRVAHLYIFYGPRGTGKTSCARVFATALNCLSSGEQRPCGSCGECLASDFGKSTILKEFHAGNSHVVRNLKLLLHEVTWSYSPQYRVYLIDECQALSSQSWNAFLKVVEEAPNNIVFILSTSCLEQLPNTVVSRCQKFLFSKVKESDIINRLKVIASQEGLEVDEGAFKLMASACDGSLRDAEMMLDQLSLLGQKISLSMVQELMGLIPDDKLLELLDFSLSADTVNTVRKVKELIVSGVEPLNLMSQIACLITSILAGGYQIPDVRHSQKFFRKKDLTKDDMEKLRQALKTLSEAEKQLRGSSDRTTWLTAALLQLAPDQSYVSLSPTSDFDTSATHSPLGGNDRNETSELNSSSQGKSESLLEASHSGAHLVSLCEGASNGLSDSSKVSLASSTKNCITSHHIRSGSRKSKKSRQGFESGDGKDFSSAQCCAAGETAVLQTTLTNHARLEEVWQRFLDAVHSNSLRKFLQMNGKLLSLSLYTGFAVALLEFGQLEHTSRAERSRASIEYAFQVTLGYAVEVKVRLASLSGEKPAYGNHPSSYNGTWQPERLSSANAVHKHGFPAIHGMDEIQTERGDKRRLKSIEVFGSTSVDLFKPPQTSWANQSFERINVQTGPILRSASEDKLENAWAQGAASCDFPGKFARMDIHDQAAEFMSISTGQSKVSLGFAIQENEGSLERCSREVQFDHINDGSNRSDLRHRGSDASSSDIHGDQDAMVARLEEENLKLESRSRGFLCWKNSETGHEKVKQLEHSPRRPGLLLTLCPCANSNQS